MRYRLLLLCWFFWPARKCTDLQVRSAKSSIFLKNRKKIKKCLNFYKKIKIPHLQIYFPKRKFAKEQLSFFESLFLHFLNHFLFIFWITFHSFFESLFIVFSFFESLLFVFAFFESLFVHFELLSFVFQLEDHFLFIFELFHSCFHWKVSFFCIMWLPWL